MLRHGNGGVDLRVAAQLDRYDHATLLGRGGSAEVYRAHDPRLNRDVAIKILRRDDDESSRRMLQEARAQARLEHPGICRIYEIGQQHDQVYIAMEFIDGEELGAAAMKLSITERVALIAQVADALQVAHDAGLIHRDIKPSNIMVTRRKGVLRPVVVDFGLVADRAVDRTLTRDGFMVGTPPYMAPEQIRKHRRDLDARVDIYGLGATLYQLLTGQPPFVCDSDAELLMRVLREPPPRPRTMQPSVPPVLENIVLRCLAKRPEERYPTTRALALDLRRFLAGETVYVRRPSSPQRALRRPGSVLPSSVLIVLLIVVILVGVGFGIVRIGHARQDAAVARHAQQIDGWAWRIEGAVRSRWRDVGAVQAAVVTRLNVLRAAQPDDPALRAALGHVALMAGDHVRAYDDLRLARARGVRTRGLLQDLMLVIDARYQRLMQWAALCAARGHAAEARRARQRARADERQALLEVYTRAPVLAAATPVMSSLAAYHRGELVDALTHLDTALVLAPWRHELHRLRGNLILDAAHDAAERGDRAAVRERLDQADAAYGRALYLAPSDPETHRDRCLLGAARLDLQRRNAGADADHAEAAWRELAVCLRARTTEPNDDMRRWAVARLHFHVQAPAP
ncbi:MAG: serine/threonine-protein kinase [Acidobacteriota bacterium]